MRALSHVELAALHEAKRFDELWQYSLSMVRLVVGRMARNNVIRAEDAEDLEQQGALIAGEAVRTWRPLECALSTHVGNQVRWGVLKFAGRERNHGIGSYEQQAVVLSTEVRFGTPASTVVWHWGDEDEDDATSFGDSLTYAGAVKAHTGQLDGVGYVPEGFGDPADEADKLRVESAVRTAAESLRDSSERKVVLAVLRGESPDAYADRTGQHRATVYRRLAAAQSKLRRKLSNSEQKEYGSEECT